MKKIKVAALVTVGVIVGSLFNSTIAQAGSICNNGSYSSNSGRGTCSWNGGVNRNFPSFSDPGSSSFNRNNGYGSSRNNGYGSSRNNGYGSSRNNGLISNPYDSGLMRDPYGSMRDPYSSMRDPYGSMRDPYSSMRDPYGSMRDPYGWNTQKPRSRW